jgi:hypothetical protein
MDRFGPIRLGCGREVGVAARARIVGPLMGTAAAARSPADARTGGVACGNLARPPRERDLVAGRGVGVWTTRSRGRPPGRSLAEGNAARVPPKPPSRDPRSATAARWRRNRPVLLRSHLAALRGRSSTSVLQLQLAKRVRRTWPSTDAFARGDLTAVTRESWATPTRVDCGWRRLPDKGWCRNGRRTMNRACRVWRVSGGADRPPGDRGITMHHVLEEPMTRVRQRWWGR